MKHSCLVLNTQGDDYNLQYKIWYKLVKINHSC